MSVRIIQDRLQTYSCRSTTEEQQALREVTQEIVLAALGRTDFFQRASFQGGTCLRIFHGVDRFSEDLDFALQRPDSAFSFRPYLDTLTNELHAYGYELEIDDRHDAGVVRKVFLKDDSLGQLLRLAYRPQAGPLQKLRIKLEVDTRPPAGASSEAAYLDFPFVSSVTVYDLPSLFAGKVHALLCRPYAKGRDWHDFLWYTTRQTNLNYVLLSSALDQMGPWQGAGLVVNREWVTRELHNVIETVDWRDVANDVRRFIRPEQLPSLRLWGAELFDAQVGKIPATEP